jgi:ankyrin repeat protein
VHRNKRNIQVDNNMADNDNQKALYAAVLAGNIDEVERLLAVPGIDVNKPDVYRFTPLIMATETRQLPIVERLLAVPGIDVNKAKTDAYGYSPLHIASEKGLLPIVKRLLAVPGIDVNKTSESDDIPLMIALTERHTPVLKELLAHPEIDVNKVSGYRNIPLFLARHNINNLNLLLAHPEIDVNKIGVSDADADLYLFGGYTVLHHAAEDGLLKVVKRLLAVPGIDIMKRTTTGLTALDIARKYGRHAVAAVLERREADIRAAKNLSSLRSAIGNANSRIGVLPTGVHSLIGSYLTGVKGSIANQGATLHARGVPIPAAAANANQGGGRRKSTKKSRRMRRKTSRRKISRLKHLVGR